MHATDFQDDYRRPQSDCFANPSIEGTSKGYRVLNAPNVKL